MSRYVGFLVISFDCLIFFALFFFIFLLLYNSIVNIIFLELHQTFKIAMERKKNPSAFIRNTYTILEVTPHYIHSDLNTIISSPGINKEMDLLSMIYLNSKQKFYLSTSNIKNILHLLGRYSFLNTFLLFLFSLIFS